jgi:sugar phosphate isomerase/epimerase
MRLAGHTYPYRDRSLDDALDEIAGLGLSTVEVWLGHAADPGRVVRAVRERGLDVAAVSAGGIYALGSDVPARAFELAEALEAPVVVASIAPPVLGHVGERIPAGITLCVENHWDHALARSRDLETVLGGHNLSVAACLDTGHAILAGESPEHFVTMLGTRVRHVHLKDAAFPSWHERLAGRRVRARLLPRPTPIYPGTGALDLDRFRRALEGARFEGTVSLEFEGSDPTAALARLLDAWASSSKGHVASG